MGAIVSSVVDIKVLITTASQRRSAVSVQYLRCESLLVVKRRMKKKVIIDVDTGVDDAQAIMVALAAPDVEVLGITCCEGNTPLENVLKNTLRVLKVCNRLDVSLWIYRGFEGVNISRRDPYTSTICHTP